MVVGNFAVIYGVAIQLLGQWCANLAKEVGNFLKNIFTDISATRTGVGGELLLIKRLCEGEGLICRKAVTYISLLLQSGQVIQEGWSCMRHLSCDLCDRKRAETA